MSIILYYGINVFIDFDINLLIFIYYKKTNFQTILFIVNYHIKIIYYKLVKTIIAILNIIKVIINILVYYIGLYNFIISNQDFIFILKFFFLLSYFLIIKNKLFVTF